MPWALKNSGATPKNAIDDLITAGYLIRILMQEMNGVHLDRTADVNRDLHQVIQSTHQLIQRIFVIFIQHKSKAALILVLTKKNHRAHEIGIFQKGISDQ